MKINPDHATSTQLTEECLRLIFRAGWSVRANLPLDSGRRLLLEPDLAVVTGSIRDHTQLHPTNSSLVVEGSSTTVRKDLAIKSHLYAQAGLRDFWIVNLVDRQHEVNRIPGSNPARKRRIRYADVTIEPESGTISPLAAPESQVAVADLLP